MARDESHHLFSKVANFVRHPLRDWSALNAQESVAPVDAYSRDMLKAMIERRQRNDFVRRREFGMLRKLRQREAAGVGDSTSLASSFSMSSSGRSAGRALTLKKIDEIEEQMSQQWWKGKVSRARPVDTQNATDFHVNTDMMTTLRARAYADTVLSGAPPTAIDGSMLSLFGPAETAPATLAAAVGTSAPRLLVDASIEEAAICFARGDDAGSETVLLQTILPGSPGADHEDCWHALFDLYRATGDVEKFERVRLRYVQRFGRLGPSWVSLRLLAREALLVAARPSAAAPAALPLPGNGWTCSAHLTREGLGELMRVLGAAGPVWVLDWRALTSIDATAVAPLKTLFVHWSSTAVQLRFSGGATLLAVLAAATPTGDRATAVVWWELRMSVLRAMHDPDNFEFVALNYCLTYEVSPPPWEDPHCNFMSLESSSSEAGTDAAGLPRVPSHHDPIGITRLQPASGQAVLAGHLKGGVLGVWSRLDADLAGAGTSVISCAALLRIDFSAAGELLDWVVARDAQGGRVEFIHVHRLVAAFFKVMGIADHASVSSARND